MTLIRNARTGVYTGNGSSQTVSIGWQPALVVIASARSTGPPTGRGLSFHILGMAAASMLTCSDDGTFFASQGITLTSTGFSVGNEDVINRNTDTFYWAAWRQGPHVDVGTYTGDGVGPDSILLGPTSPVNHRTPGFVVVLRTTTAPTVFVSALNSFTPTAYNSFFRTSVVATPSSIDHVAGGFSVNNDANVSGETYFWAAIQAGLNVGTRMTVSQNYIGNDAAPRTLAISGQQPQVVWLTPGGLDYLWAFKTIDMPAGEHAQLATRYEYISSGVTILSNGVQLADALPYNDGSPLAAWNLHETLF
jgi:hypothetical protein